MTAGATDILSGVGVIGEGMPAFNPTANPVFERSTMAKRRRIKRRRIVPQRPVTVATAGEALVRLATESHGRSTYREIFAHPPTTRQSGFAKFWHWLTTEMNPGQWSYLQRNHTAAEIDHVAEDAQFFAKLLNDFSLVRLNPQAEQGCHDALAEFRRQANELQLEGLL